MDISEVRKLAAYLRKLFGNSRIRVVPEEGDTASVFVGEERLGALVVDDEDDERSYNFEIKITFGEAATAKNLRTIETYLRRKFDNERIRVTARARKSDSAEVSMGQEYIGVLFFDEQEKNSCFFEMPILALDLEDVEL